MPEDLNIKAVRDSFIESLAGASTLQELDEITRNVTLAKKNDTIKVLSLQ